MKAFSLLALAAISKIANAHATVYAIWVNDVDQGLGNSASGYIRSPPNNNPITDVKSSGMTCNVNNSPTAKTIEVSGGDKITFEWHHNNRDASDDIIASSHLGPVMVYIAPTSSNGEGDVWVKLYEDGFTGTYGSGTWAVTTLINNKGKHSITLPNLEPGEYLLRPEIIALHEGNREGGAQFYMECVQIKVTSSGSVSLPAGVAFPGAYSATDKGILFDIYNSFSSYPIPGPTVWDGATGGSKPTAASSAAASVTPTATPVVSSSAPTSDVAAVSTAEAEYSTSAAPVVTSTPVGPSSSVVTPTTFATHKKPHGGKPTGKPVWYECDGKIEVHYE
jgi:lytic cellulose monooxygenase (C1-hydroxylating)